MQINFEKKEKALIVKIDGELDHHSASDVRMKIDGYLSKYNIETLLFDFTKLSFMDSSGIGVIIGRYKIVKAMGGNIAIISSNMQVDKLLTISGIKKIVPIYKSLDLALNS